MIEIKPIIADLSTRAARWWELTVQSTMEVYATWLDATPLERLRVPPPQPVWMPGLGDQQVINRLEQRVTTVLMPALTEEVRLDIITNRHMWPAAILFKVMKTYQPGGWAERAGLLADLTETKPAKDATTASAMLRMWKRQRARAVELRATLPDNMLQVRALDKIVGNLLGKHPQVAFRISTFRLEARIDERPSNEALMGFHELLTAEMDTLMHSAPVPNAPKEDQPAAKALQGDPKSPPRDGGEEKVCKYWGTEKGCFRGKECKFSHPALRDGIERCWICSGTGHRKAECPHKVDKSEGPESTTTKNPNHKKGGGKGGGQAGIQPGGSAKGSGKDKGKKGEERSQKAAQKEDEAPPVEKSSTYREDKGQKETPTNTGSTELVAEVTNLLKSLQVKGDRSMRAMKLAEMEYQFGVKKIQKGDGKTLLDGGATHCMRQARNAEEWRDAEEVQVTLAAGQTTMRQCRKTGTLLVDYQVQKIIPVTKLTKVGYVVHWDKKECRVEGPEGCIPVQLQQGCPVVEDRRLRSSRRRDGGSWP